MPYIKCPKCGHEVSSTAIFCSNCGLPGIKIAAHAATIGACDTMSWSDDRKMGEAENSNSEHVLRALSKDKDAAVRWRVPFNHSCPIDVLRDLATDEDADIRRGVGLNPNTPTDVLRVLAKDEADDVRVGPARNPSTPTDVLRDLSSDASWNVRWGCAKNPSMPEDVLLVLAKDEDEDVRMEVVLNPSTTIGVLRTMADDDSFHVQAVLKSRILEEINKEPSPVSKSISIGSNYILGSWGNENIVWRVLDIQGDRALLITEKAIDCLPYNNYWTSTTWEICTLRAWLNEEFIRNAFDSFALAKICETTITNPNNPSTGTWGGNSTRDKVFLLSIDETKRYFSSDEDRVCHPTYHAEKRGVWKNIYGAVYWWLRSPGLDHPFAAGVKCGGGVDENGDGVSVNNCAVRPAIWIKL